MSIFIIREESTVTDVKNRRFKEQVIFANDLTKRFGHFTAVDQINFGVKQGEILGFLGPNGAGKTTTIKMMVGLLKITSGKVWVKDYDVSKDLRQIKKNIGYMSQKFSLYPLLNGYENIEFWGGISGLSCRAIKEKKELISEEISSRILSQKVKDIPPGIKQRIALFSCLISDPEIILLDEPTSGVDPEVRREFWGKIYDLKKKGKTLLVTTHNLDEAEYADRILIIHQGRIVLRGEPSVLMRKEKTDSMEKVFKQAVTNNETN
ncbi:MAG: ATP-binding cassette domain-containing protein [Candidatus Aminicenantes bacterium]|nr:ATP-binding cassette domain-containing protein [Candidatus Aminicenantes bacterium]